VTDRPKGTDVLVRLDGITKSFGAVIAVDDVNFDLRHGEVHALVGENGAGKSTLMKVLAGVTRPTAGTVRIGDQEVEFSGPHDAETAGIAMIPQELELFDELTVAENMYVGRSRPRRPWGAIDTGTMRKEARRVFAALGVDINPTDAVKHLSTANRQLVAIARALLGDAAAVIMDEPTAALSIQEAERLFQVIRDLTSHGVGVIYISHRLEEIFEISNRITVMRDGRHIRTDDVANLTEYDLVKLMVGRPLDQFFARDHKVSGEVLLELRDFARHGAFQDVNLTVRKGEVVGLAGLIGAGRTELAHAIFGMAPATGGEMLLDGRPVRIGSPKAALAHGIAYVPEERRSQGLILPFSSTQNISFSTLKRLSRNGFLNFREERQVASEFGEKLGIKGAPLDAPVTRLSGGNQQKVVVAKALLQDPALLVLDEPTRGVDVGAKSEIYRLINDLAAEGKAVLLISSELIEILSMSDRVYVMRDGTIAAQFAHEDASEETLLAAATGTAVVGNGV
jgi:ABC-type sugar transport system ATPase subunit